MEYRTISGDMFDDLAHKFYGDETLAIHIIEANIEYADVVVFGSGVNLKIPEIEVSTPTNLPPWKRGDN